MTVVELDPRFDWVEIQAFGDAGPRYVRAACRHIDAVPVDSDGVTVAWLCPTCDQRLV